MAQAALQQHGRSLAAVQPTALWRWAGASNGGPVMLAPPEQPVVSPRPPRVWLTPARSLALRIVVALTFLAALGTALTLLRPPPPSPPVRIALPPPLPDPSALLPYRPETAREANAAMPITPPSAAAPPFRLGPGGTAVADPGVQTRALDCLAAAAWYEAGDDPSGERAVVQVVLNRARHPAFPSNVCSVVFQGSERTTGCQFSFTCDGSMQSRRPSPAAWTRARAVASAALTGEVDPRVGLATHYHADYVVPVWRSGLVKLAQVGLHLFYRWPGTWGAPGVLRKSASGDEPRIAALAALSPAHVRPGEEAASTAESAAQLAYLPLEDADGPVKSVGSGVVIPPSRNTNHITIMFDPAVFPGTYAMRALAVCAEKERCAVFGQLLGASPAQGPGFIYVRDRRTGAEGAWWDCKALPRANPTRCLPQGPALDRLLEDWG